MNKFLFCWFTGCWLVPQELKHCPSKCQKLREGCTTVT